MSFHERREAWKSIINEAASTAPESWTELPNLKSKARLHILAAREIRTLDHIDGLDLGEMYLQSHADGSSTQELLDLVNTHRYQTWFYVAFLERLAHKSLTDSVPQDVVDQVKAMVTTLAPLFDIDSEPRSTSPPAQPSFSAFEDGLARIIALCVSHGQVNEAQTIFGRAAAQSPNVSLPSLRSLLTLLFEAIPAALKELAAPEKVLASLHTAARSVLGSYLARVVEPRPLAPPDWARPTFSCERDCADCRTVNAFLRQPHQQKANILLTKDRCKHVQSNMYRDRTAHASTDVGIDHQPREYRIVLKKHSGAYEKSLKEWKGRFNEARERLAKLDVPTLKGALGEGYREDVLSTDLARSALGLHEAGTEASRSALAAMPGNLRRPPPVDGQEPPAKRP